MTEMHFQQLYTLAHLPGSDFHTLSTYPPILESDKLFLSSELTIEEVHNSLFSMGNYKSPGPYGFHPLFFKTKWETIGPCFLNFVKSVFHRSEEIISVNQTLLTLIPKGEAPINMT